jgi:heme o synthase
VTAKATKHKEGPDVRHTKPSFSRDLVALTKPRISVLSVATAAAGLAMAPGDPSANEILVCLAGTLLLVGSANTLNMWMERDVDGLMARTKDRPLPAGRLAAPIALVFGLVQAAISIPLLAFGTNLLTGALGALALFLYVLVYTPMKRKSTLSLLVGAIPGAMPPLLGWTAATGELSTPALAVFFMMFLWQVPHFLAIALFRRDEYIRAGLKTLPGERGDAAARQQLFIYLIAQIAVTMALVPLGLGGPVYLFGALALGAWQLIEAGRGMGPGGGDARWARRFFFATVAYLPLLFVLLVTA